VGELGFRQLNILKPFKNSRSWTRKHNNVKRLFKGEAATVYTVAGKAVGFAHEQPLHVVTLACPAFRILKRLQHISIFLFIVFDY
jgi:hypothetical protein